MKRPLLAAVFLFFAAGCNTKTVANDRRCRTLDAEACRADSTCVAVGGTGLEPFPDAIARGQRCEPACAAGGLPPECSWAPAGTIAADPARLSKDGRVCAGPARCVVNRTNSGDYCFDPDPPCAGCRQIFDHCQSANLCSGVICP